MRNRILKYLKDNLKDACLDSFGIKQQFIELEFSSSKFDEIKFFVDCRVSTTNSDITQFVKSFNKINEDSYEIIYFIAANLKTIIDCELNNEGNFVIEFENRYAIVFDLSSSQEPLSISFTLKVGSQPYKSVCFEYGGEIYISPDVESL